jgi:VIT1/CCC1 family predicted Fe2+/Mn2+ transporter
MQNMIRGGFVFILGALVTIGTYAFMHDRGGMFMIAWGAILFGAVRFLYGLTQYFS